MLCAMEDQKDLLEQCLISTLIRGNHALPAGALSEDAGAVAGKTAAVAGKPRPPLHFFA